MEVKVYVKHRTGFLLLIVCAAAVLCIVDHEKRLRKLEEANKKGE